MGQRRRRKTPQPEPQAGSLPIIRTKLHRPPVGADLVCRSRLHDRLDAALKTPLTLVVAPAGYGKSMLVSHWAETLEQPCAWYSLDATDSDPRTFLSYVVATVEAVWPGACGATRNLLDAHELPSIRAIATYLLNDLDEFDHACPIVLDDYHRLDRSSPVHELIESLLEHPAPQLHLVILARRDPPLPLASLRAGNQVTDVRLQDLRFTDQEAKELLLTSMNLEVSRGALANLQQGVEGWAAGLRLLMLVLRRTESADDFLRELHGGFPQIEKYLLQEVLAGLEPDTRECLLHASILDRFCSSLLGAVCVAGAVSPVDRGREILDELRDLFTIPLDANREWFRFHHHFQHLLQQQLGQQSSADEIGALHARAGEWFESQDLITEAVAHSLAAGDVARAAEIVERHRRRVLDEDRWFVLKQWLELLPTEVKEQRLELLLCECWVANAELDLARNARFLDRVEAKLPRETAEPLSLAEVNFFRGSLHYWEGNGEEARRCLEAAQRQHPARTGMVAGEVGVYFALAQQMTGHGAAALRMLEEDIPTGKPSDEVFRTRWLAAQQYIHLLAGNLAPAIRSSSRLRTTAVRMSNTYAEAWGHLPGAIAHLHAHRLEDALHGFQFVDRWREIVERRGCADALAGLALAYQLLQRPESATATVEDLAGFARATDDPECIAVAESCRARVLLLQGHPGPAIDWARSAALGAPAPTLLFWLEIPWITRARVLVEEGDATDVEDALESLNELRAQFETQHAICHLIEVVVLHAVALEKLGRTDEANAALLESLDLATAGSWVRPFVEAGPVMADLLRRVEPDGRRARLVERIFSVSVQHTAPAVAQTPAARAVEAPSQRGPVLLDPLTNRELDVLECLAQRLSNKEIATRLFVSTHTVSDHLKRIYGKLHVHGRRQAVQRAAELGILDLR